MLRGLDYLRRAGVAPDGRWPLEVVYPGLMAVEMDQREGGADRWMTLRAMRVVHWYAAGG